MITRTSFCLLLLVAIQLAACGEAEPIAPERFVASDELFSQVVRNVDATPQLDLLLDIDHARLGAAVGSVMAPARVVMISDHALESELMAMNPLVALDLPLRVLAYEPPETEGDAAVIANRYAYLQSRYGLPERTDLAERYLQNVELAMTGIPEAQRSDFDQDRIAPPGIIHIASELDFSNTLIRLDEVIESQDDTVQFGRVDFRANAARVGKEIKPATLVLFGGPDPGAKAMNPSPTLGLDAFCQKFLVWEDEDGNVTLSFNDLLALAERQGVEKNVALRVVNRRLESTFRDAFKSGED